MLWGEYALGRICSGEKKKIGKKGENLANLICSGENMLWGEEENWQKRREFSKF
ncbi:MAG TPA: hypothetical protein PLB63_11955 [Planctomycetota bacterium]|nr:hypothetical protein [Planctomycetota bacterium]